MKKMTKFLGIIALLAVIGFGITACDDEDDGKEVTGWKGLNVHSGTSAYQYNEFEGKQDVLRVTSSGSAYEWAVLTYDLGGYAGKQITINLEMDVYLQPAGRVAWQVNEDGFPLVAGAITGTMPSGTWHNINNSRSLTITAPPEGDLRALYLSGQQLGNDNEVYIANFFFCF
jgi:mannose-6-phosphate isomerase-like protein (cupin superfamily)